MQNWLFWMFYPVSYDLLSQTTWIHLAMSHCNYCLKDLELYRQHLFYFYCHLDLSLKLKIGSSSPFINIIAQKQLIEIIIFYS